MEHKEAPIRELFIAELTEVRGGQSLDKFLDGSALWRWIQEHLYTTLACGEEGPC